MFLTASNLSHYTVMRGIVDPSDIVNGDFAVLEAGRQNRNFKVRVGQMRSVFLKQIKELGVSAELRILKEATCYRVAQSFPQWAAHIPRFIDYDESRHCLAIELLPRAENVFEIALRRNEIPLDIAVLLGKALADYQSCLTYPDDLQAETGFLRQQTPWILTNHLRSLFAEGAISAGAVQFGGVVRGLPKLQEHLARLRCEWRFDALMHGDMKLDNCLAFADDKGQQQVRIIDWELVDFGDASWDVAGFFQSCIAFKIKDLKQIADVTTDVLLTQMSTLMIDTFPALSGFWSSYVATLQLDEAKARAHLLRCVEFAGVRLLQTAFESLFDSKEMNSTATLLLSLSQEILDDPKLAAARWFGFSQGMSDGS